MGGQKKNPELQKACPVRDVLDRLGDRWTVLVMSELESGTLRFSEIRKRVMDISPRMLAQTLRNLEQDGLVKRDVYPTVPPKVEYTFTSLGESFYERVKAMINWAADNHDAVRAARERYVAPETHHAK
ncbi:winged helix-turn-helix transcriptional regulator [Gynuella sp.]|uniref:winged helix-turn-helix transcriptional regulator n=1 Tax=Gynuella sp. TaxID=2969146 RepID=UPI003D108212